MTVTSSRTAEIARNYFASMAFLTLWLLLLLGLTCWPGSPKSIDELFHIQFEFGSWSFHGIDVIVAVYTAYLLLLVPYYLTLPPGYPTKCRMAWGVILGPRRPNAAETTALLSLGVKGIYIPMMSVWAVQHVWAMSRSAAAAGSLVPVFDVPYWVHFIFLLDVGMFLFGYCVEHPRLGNEIRSVEPTVLGWLVALICYPPLRQFAIAVFEENPVLVPLDDPMLRGAITAMWVLLFGIYMWATLALNVRASNLTNRGIVGSGPYRYVRHPAYAAKNFAWWLAAATVIASRPTFEPATLGAILLGTLAWSAIYYVRAITEERHLMRDPDYQDYCRQTRWRFVPGIY